MTRLRVLAQPEIVVPFVGHGAGGGNQFLLYVHSLHPNFMLLLSIQLFNATLSMKPCFYDRLLPESPFISDL